MVIPAKAGIQTSGQNHMDSRFRGNDKRSWYRMSGLSIRFLPKEFQQNHAEN